MQAISYKLLAEKAVDQSTKNLLIDLCEHEEKDTEEWRTTVDEYIDSNIIRSPRLEKERVRLMMTILGPRSFLEWNLIGEDELIEELLIFVGLLKEKSISDNLIRIVNDEHLHVIQMKKDF